MGRQRACNRLAQQLVDANQKRRQRFTRSSGRRNQRRMSGLDAAPTFNLRFSGRSESPNKPLLRKGMSPIEAGRNRELGTGLQRGVHGEDCTGSIRFLFAILQARILWDNLNGDWVCAYRGEKSVATSQLCQQVQNLDVQPHQRDHQPKRAIPLHILGACARTPLSMKSKSSTRFSAAIITTTTLKPMPIMPLPLMEVK